jgi:hypothetical protein
MSLCYFFNPEPMAEEVEGYLAGRADYARACATRLGGGAVHRSNWESPASRI